MATEVNILNVPIAETLEGMHVLVDEQQTGEPYRIPAALFFQYDSNGNIPLREGAKILGTNETGSQHEVLGLGEYEISGSTYDQVEVGSESIHLNLNTNTDPIYGDHVTVDTPSGKKVISYADEVSGSKRYSTMVNTPAWTNQPTISESALNSAFVDWNEDYYYATLKDTDGSALPAGQFKLTPVLDSTRTNADYTQAVAQVFSLAGLATGNSGTITESMPVDFLQIGSAWKIRSGSVTSVQMDIGVAYQMGYDIEMISCIKCYNPYYSYYRPVLTGISGNNVFGFCGVGAGYNLANGFTFAPSAFVHKRKHTYSNEVFRWRLLQNSQIAEYSRKFIGWDGSLNNRTNIINTGNSDTNIIGMALSIDPVNSPVSSQGVSRMTYLHGALPILNGSSLTIILTKRTE